MSEGATAPPSRETSQAVTGTITLWDDRKFFSGDMQEIFGVTYEQLFEAANWQHVDADLEIVEAPGVQALRESRSIPSRIVGASYKGRDVVWVVEDDTFHPLDDTIVPKGRLSRRLLKPHVTATIRKHPR